MPCWRGTVHRTRQPQLRLARQSCKQLLIQLVHRCKCPCRHQHFPELVAQAARPQFLTIVSSDWFTIANGYAVLARCCALSTPAAAPPRSPELRTASHPTGSSTVPVRRFQVHNNTFQSIFFLKFVCASDEAVLGTRRYLSKHFLIKICSRLRRGDFRYTTILFKSFSY